MPVAVSTAGNDFIPIWGKVPVFAGVTGSVAPAEVAKVMASLGEDEVVAGAVPVSATLAHLGSMSMVLVGSFIGNPSPADVTPLSCLSVVLSVYSVYLFALSITALWMRFAVDD